jgi:hypothetical protein
MYKIIIPTLNDESQTQMTICEWNNEHNMEKCQFSWNEESIYCLMQMFLQKRNLANGLWLKIKIR